MDKMEPIEKEDKIEKTDDTCGNVYDPKCGKNKTKLELEKANMEEAKSNPNSNAAPSPLLGPRVVLS